MKLKTLMQKYRALMLLLIATAAFLAASVLLLVSVYLLGVEVIGRGELQAFCPLGNSTIHCASRWWAPMVGGLVLILVGSVLWPMGVRRWRERAT